MIVIVDNGSGCAMLGGMKIETTFKTRKSAIKYLTTRGWVQSSYGRWFIHNDAAMDGQRRSVSLICGVYEIISTSGHINN